MTKSSKSKVYRPKSKPTKPGQLSTFRLAPESKAQLRTIEELLRTSTEVSAIQLAVTYLFERLHDIAPRSATPAKIDSIYRKHLAEVRGN